MLEAEVLDCLPGSDVLEAWRALAVLAGNPFTSPEWIAAWVQTQRRVRVVIVCCRSRDGALVGVVPLTIDDRGRLASAATAWADWFGPACAPEHEAEVARATTAALGHRGYLKRRWTMTRCLTSAGWLAGVRGPEHRRYTLVATGAEAELSLVRFSEAPTIVGKARRENARLLRRLNEMHEVEFRCARTRQEAEDAFPVFERLHTQRWPDLRTPESANFHRAFALRAGEQDWLRLWTLVVDGKPAAMLYGWRLGVRSFAYMQAYDAAWGRHGVGILLLDHAVRAAEEEGSEVFDMLRGQERHKTRYQNDQRTVRTFVLVGRGSYARLAVHSRASARLAYRRLPSRHRSAVRRLLRG